MGRHRWRAAALTAALLAAACRDVTSPSPRAPGFSLLSTSSPARAFPGRMIGGTAADSAIAAQAAMYAARGDRAPLEVWKHWQSAPPVGHTPARPMPHGPRLLTMPDGYEGDDQRNAHWIWGPQSSAYLPAMAGDIEVIPGSVNGKVQYDGDNATIAIGYELTPINAGVTTVEPQDSTNGPGRRLCWYVIYCHQWELSAQRTFSGVGGCGMDLTGNVTYIAWRSRYEIYAVDYNGGITIGTNTGNYSSGYKYVFMPRSWGQIRQDDHPTDRGSNCETESCTVTGTDGGETGGGVTGDANRVVAAPRFDCQIPVGTGSWTSKVCITWETGYFDLETGARVVLATWVECYLLDENGGWLRVDRAGTEPPLTLDGDVPPLAPAPGGGGAASEHRVTLVGVSALPGASPTRLVRRKRGPLGDAVLVDLGRARPEDIASAVDGLRVMLAVQGDSGAAATDASIAFSDLGKGWAGEHRRRAADRLAALAAAPVRDIPGLGRVHALDISVTLPNVRRVGGSVGGGGAK